MQIIRFTRAHAPEPSVGVVTDQLVSTFAPGTTVGSLLRYSLDELRARCQTPDGEQLSVDEIRLLPPLDGLIEVWAAGVTYENSRRAEIEESGLETDMFARVYEAWKVRGHGEPISFQSGSPINVPAPGAAIVVNAFGEVVGLTVCNDVISRNLDTKVPRSPSQAKVYAGACAVGPGIRPIWEVAHPEALEISMQIRRGRTLAWTGNASTAKLKRGPDELIGRLFSSDDFPEGAVLSTGTCLSPELPFTIKAGDVVTVSLEGFEAPVNAVAVGIDDSGRRFRPARRASAGRSVEQTA